jgi:hypothetical protein
VLVAGPLAAGSEASERWVAGFHQFGEHLPLPADPGAAPSFE